MHSNATVIGMIVIVLTRATPQCEALEGSTGWW